MEQVGPVIQEAWGTLEKGRVAGMEGAMGGKKAQDGGGKEQKEGGKGGEGKEVKEGGEGKEVKEGGEGKDRMAMLVEEIEKKTNLLADKEV